MPEETKCPKCGGEIVSKGVIGTDRHNQEMEADWEECEKCGFNPEGFMTPQEQAEAMVDEIFTQGPYLISTAKRNQLITALSKLIEENERLKDESRTWQERCDEMASIAGKENQKLTATEAKLEEAKEVLEKWAEIERQCNAHGAYDELNKAARSISIFLSTPTAEKKEETK